MFRAPGRVNLIGEHTDYNDGFVMPCALPLETCVAAHPRRDSRICVASLDYNGEVEFEIGGIRKQDDWSDYVRGVAATLASAGLLKHGSDLMIRSDVPVGSGLSSSAAVEVATALALLATGETKLSGTEVARLCQRAENEFVGARCGIMDQFVSANASAGHALLLDCRSIEYKLLAIPREISLLICNSMVKHAIAGGEYNVRRAECEEGVRLLRSRWPSINSLRDVSAEQLEASRDLLPELIYRRCRHVVTENARVLSMSEALAQGDLSKVRECMAGSHRSLRDDYEVSCPELDTLVEIAVGCPGVIGSRMTGGGFGGCTVTLVERGAVEQVRATVIAEYQRRMGIVSDTYVCVAAAGASEIV